MLMLDEIREKELNRKQQEALQLSTVHLKVLQRRQANQEDRMFCDCELSNPNFSSLQTRNNSTHLHDHSLQLGMCLMYLVQSLGHPLYCKNRSLLDFQFKRDLISHTKPLTTVGSAKVLDHEYQI